MAGARLISFVLIAIAFGGATALAAQPAPGPMREVNITTDSAPGWLPSEALEREALAALARFFAAVEAGDDADAYAMMTEIFRAHSPFPEYAAENARVRSQAGALLQRRVLKITWTKDPADAPFPGVYAAIDVSARYANVDRQCGYIVLYQSPAGGAFGVMRTESNLIDNASAREIERTRGRAELDRMWATLARNCPNFQPVVAP